MKRTTTILGLAAATLLLAQACRDTLQRLQSVRLKVEPMARQPQPAPRE